MSWAKEKERCVAFVRGPAMERLSGDGCFGSLGLDGIGEW